MAEEIITTKLSNINSDYMWPAEMGLLGLLHFLAKYIFDKTFKAALIKWCDKQPNSTKNGTH